MSTSEQKDSNIGNVPIAPFNIDPFKLAVLATLLSGGNNPALHLPAAASIYAAAVKYTEELRLLFYGSKAIKVPGWEVWSLGEDDEWMDVRTACAKYSIGQRHLRDSLRQILPPHLFDHFWTPPVNRIRLPKTLLDGLEQTRSFKRSARTRKAVKSA